MRRSSRLETVGHLQQFGGTRLVTLEDGNERGVRVIEFRTTTGLEFGVLVDRAMDIGWCRYQGRSIAWHSQTGFAGPWYREPQGDGFLRSFGGGLLTTCGLDHILDAERDEQDTYNFVGRTGSDYGVHGRISSTPATLRSYGETWDGDACVLHAEGDIGQAGALAENLVLRRRISADLDDKAITWEDVVENVGHLPTPHMLLYHLNLGAPLLDRSCELIAPSTTVTPAGSYQAHLEFHPPQRDSTAEVYSHELAAKDGRVAVALVNRGNPDRPWGVVLRYEAKRFPYFFQWRYFAAGTYVLGLEPSTNGLTGRAAARRSGELTLLAPGERRRYVTTLEILSEQDEVDAVRDEILAST